MKGKFFVLLGLAFLLAVPAYAFDDHDFQVWNIFDEEMKINQDWKLTLEEEFHYGDNASELFYQHYDLAALYGVNKWLSVGGGYRHVLNKSNNDYKVENAPFLTATLSGDWQGIKFDDRHRLEYQHFDYQADDLRYRNKVTVRFPWKFTKLEIQPFLSDEIFIRFGGMKSLNQNRFSAGFGLNLTKNLKAEIYYMLQSFKSSGTWLDANVLNTRMKFSF